MYTSNLFFPTEKNFPADAEIASHKLMLKSGMIKKLSSGLYTWLPLGYRILQKVVNIVRTEMNKTGAQEIFMPAIQPAELWEETARWAQFGPQLLKMQDRHKRNFCFGPTHEEVVTDLIRGTIKSYKQLPLCLYQIQTKFRDEIRPRFGVMRAREFLMKDAYSFHLDLQSLENTYEIMYNAYANIISQLGLNYRAVLADSGNIGGSKSHEFHVLAQSGEDALAISDTGNYAANIELAASYIPADISRQTALNPLDLVTTPNIKTIESLSIFLALEAKYLLKTLLVKGKNPDYPAVAILMRGDHELNPIKAEKHPLIKAPLEFLKDTEISELDKINGFLGPIDLALPIIADHAVLALENFCCGANQVDKHYINVNWERDLPRPANIADLRLVVQGDKSPDGNGQINIVRGIEVGHIFQLGDKYSVAMHAEILDNNGKSRPVIMGCYGIGISRMVAAAIEQSHDDKGIIWPQAIAPFTAIIIPLGFHKDDLVKQTAIKLYEDLVNTKIEVLLDDRKETPGSMFKDAELIGIPFFIIISRKNLDSNQAEIQTRKTQVTEIVALEQIADYVRSKLCF